MIATATGRPGATAVLDRVARELAEDEGGGVGELVHVPIPQVRGGAEIMYYGGEVAELPLAAALVVIWRSKRRAGERTPA